MESLEDDAHARRLDGSPPTTHAMSYPENYHMLASSPNDLHSSGSQHYQTMTFAFAGLQSRQQLSQSMPLQPRPSHSQFNMADSPLHIMTGVSPGLVPFLGLTQACGGPSSAKTPTGNCDSSASNGKSASGPVPATTPVVVKSDKNGVDWIAFEYSRNGVKMEYTIRCDVASVNTKGLSQDFRSANCIYPRACCSKEQYQGKRFAYESKCNALGWALASLNPPLREKRGLIQRAVDSWRNSNQNPKLRSRRVRKISRSDTGKKI